jgi:hypothetical protein
VGNSNEDSSVGAVAMIRIMSQPEDQFAAAIKVCNASRNDHRGLDGDRHDDDSRFRIAKR